VHADGVGIVVDGGIDRAADGLLDASRCATAAGEKGRSPAWPRGAGEIEG